MAKLSFIAPSFFLAAATFTSFSAQAHHAEVFALSNTAFVKNSSGSLLVPMANAKPAANKRVSFASDELLSRQQLAKPLSVLKADKTPIFHKEIKAHIHLAANTSVVKGAGK